MSTTMKYTLKSSDGESFEVDEPVAMTSTTIKHIIDDDCFENGIPLPNVSAKILAMVIEYCKKHVVVEDEKKKKKKKTDGEIHDASPTVTVPDADADELKVWDKDFVDGLDNPTLFDLIMAANYLNIKNLLDLTCQAAADLIKDKKPDEVRDIFNVTNDYTEEEEKAVRAENEWAFQ